MTRVVSHWRAVYEPGDALVLAGPTSLVVLDAALDLDGVRDLWELVLASGSLPDLAHALARRFDRVPRAAVFFWTSEQIRCLLRGDVRLRDPGTGAVVADGTGVLTWTEVGLGDLRWVATELSGGGAGAGGADAPADAAGSPGAGALPLVVGAVRAARVWLEARESDTVRSPQLSADALRPVDDREATPAGPTPTPNPTPTEATIALPGPGAGSDLPDTERLPGTGARGAGPEPSTTLGLPRPVAQLEAPDGAVVLLDRPVVIGRAPSASRSGAEDPQLLAVTSRNHDVSRTHVEVWVQDGQVVVTDLHSTNGTLVIGPEPAALRVDLQPGVPLAVPVGSRLSLGGEVSVLVAEPDGQDAAGG